MFQNHHDLYDLFVFFKLFGYVCSATGKSLLIILDDSFIGDDMVQDDSHTLIIYMDDNGEKVEHWVELLEQTTTYVKFRDTKNNIITIPIHRLLKMKYKGDAQ